MGKNILKNIIFLILYYGFAFHLPTSSFPLLKIGIFSKRLRYSICKRLFVACGENVNIEKGADFGRGNLVSIDNNSGLGIGCYIGGPVIIGTDVLMGPNVKIYRQSHNYDRIDIPIRLQGRTPIFELKICDDVWIGDSVIILPKCSYIGKGSIIGANAVVSKNIPDYAIVGGIPARIIKYRNNFLEKQEE